MKQNIWKYRFWGDGFYATVIYFKYLRDYFDNFFDRNFLYDSKHSVMSVTTLILPFEVHLEYVKKFK